MLIVMPRARSSGARSIWSKATNSVTPGWAAASTLVMAVEVITPEDYLGDVMGNLNSRRGRVENLEPVGNAQVIRASVPLAEMFGYATDLRSMTQGRAEFTMQFDRYEEVPQSIATELVASDA